MKELTIEDNIVIFDEVKTNQFKTEYNSPCDCLTCKNFFSAVIVKSKVTSFLNTLGIDINRCEECISLIEDIKHRKITYEAWYSVCGNIENNFTVCVDDADINFELAEKVLCPNTNRNSGYFWVCLVITLPWVIDDNIKQLKVPHSLSLKERVKLNFRRRKCKKNYRK